MVSFSRKKIILFLLIILLLAAGLWIATRRTPRIDVATYVPQSALGYLEINDWPGLLDSFASTRAWQQLAPSYGVENKLDYIGKIGWLASFTGGHETALIARSQVAVVMTGLEVRGEEVRPRLALIVETHSSSGDLSKLIANRLPEFARKIYGREIKESSEYSGVAITSYASEMPERRLFSAQIGSEWILANHSDTLRSCIDTRLGRSPSMANNFHLQNSKPHIGRKGELFGFITGEGMTRLLRFGIFMLSSNALRETGITETLQDVLSDLASRSSDGMAFGSGFENGVVVNRYALLFKPDLVESLKPVIKPNQGNPQSLNLTPATARDVTVINVENPSKTLDGIETAISARIGVGQSFLLHQFLLGARENFFGLKSDDGLQSAMGNEISNFVFEKEPEKRVWLIEARDQGLLSRALEQYLTQQGARIQRGNFSGVEIISSSNARQGAAVFIGDFLALGERNQLIRLIEEHRRGQNLASAPQFTSASRPSQDAAVISFSSVKEESGELMAAVARWLGASGSIQSAATAVDRLPLAVSATSLNHQGVYVESHSPFGNFPFFVSLVDGATASQ
jgi:hypothetical protein